MGQDARGVWSRWIGSGRGADGASGGPGRPRRRRFEPSVAGLELEGRRLLSTAAAPSVTVVATFTGSNHTNLGQVVADSKGDIFGTASGGGDGSGTADSTVYEIPAGSNTPVTLATFNKAKGYGIGQIAVDGRGNVFGTIAEEGGATGLGKVFEIPAGTKTATTIAHFNGVDGAFPNGVIVDGQGDLFGTAAVGEVGGVASAFELPAESNTPATVAEFPNPGASPKGLVMDAQGDLFGVNPTGLPKQGYATVYEIAKGSNTVENIASFPGFDGSGVSNLSIDGQGNLYGTTQDGGAFGRGEVFEIAKGSNTVTPIASFDGVNGSEPTPAAGVAVDAQGDLFGVTERNGPNGKKDSTLFEVPAGSGTIQTIATFKNDESTYLGGIALDGQGNLFGTINGSGSGGGTVYKFKVPGTSGTA